MDRVSQVFESEIARVFSTFLAYTFFLTSGYQEKFYFNPGDTGFKVVLTRKKNSKLKDISYLSCYLVHMND